MHLQKPLAVADVFFKFTLHQMDQPVIVRSKLLKMYGDFTNEMWATEE